MKCVVLEAKDRVGGRTLSVPLKTASGTDIFDLGGQWVSTSQVDVLDLLRELDLETYNQYITGKKFMQLGGHKISSYISAIPSLSVLALLDLNSLLKKLEKMAKMADINEPYKRCPHAEKWDSLTVEEFINQNAWTKGAKDSIVSATRCMMGVELSQISLLYYLSYTNAAGSFKKMVEAGEDCGQGLKIKGGAQQISTRLAEKLGKGAVKLGHPVTSIEQTKDFVTVKTLNGAVFKCKSVIIATPPNMTCKMNFQPSLPAPKIEIMKRMPISLLNKVIITYDKAFWREAGQSGEIVTIGGKTDMEGCDEGPLSIVYDATTSKGNAALVGFIGGKQAVQWQQQSSEDRQSAVLKSLSEFFGEDVWKYKDYREKDWGLEPYIEGSPICSAAPGSMPYFASGLRHSYDRIYFAGSESATRWCGFMNGAVQAGKRAALEVIYRFHPQAIDYEEMQDAFTVSTNKMPTKRSYSYLKFSMGIGTVIGSSLLFAVYYYKIRK